MDLASAAGGASVVTGPAFVFLALALAAAFFDWVAVHQEQKALEYLCKPLTLVLLIACALALDPDDAAVRAWFVAALVLSLAGDVFLMLPQDLFVFGLGSFLLGHIAYIVGMHVDGVDGARFLVGIVIVMALLAVIGTRILRGVRAGPDPALAGPVVAYMFVISAMVASAIGVGHAMVVIGAGALLRERRAHRLEPLRRRDRATAGVAIMVTYHLAQVGLVLSLAVAAAARRARRRPTLTRMRSRCCWSVCLAWGTGCSAVNASMSAARAGSFTERMPDEHAHDAVGREPLVHLVPALVHELPGHRRRCRGWRCTTR